ncbi:MAG: glycosyltransferase, partial [Candidatus Lokiarchaeota archaeon]|nr:glycosyltransferase [Candidatus Lokiarchaeota archaeon]
SDLVVFSYNKILTSAGILLAMNFRKPIIAPRLGCIPETIDRKGAFLYDFKDENGLINALEKAMKNKNNLLEMGNYNFELAKNYAWNDIARQNKNVYERFLK